MKFNDSLQGCKTDTNDLFYTPPQLARQLINIMIEQNYFEKSDSILDPCSGKGAFINGFAHCLPENYAQLLECEIQKGSDFYEFTGYVDWVISNPPFSDLTRWLNKTLLLNPRGFAYIMPTYSLTEQRLRKIESFGYTVDSTILIRNPEHWNIGFTMAFYVFTKNGARSTRLIDAIEPQQTRLDV